MPEVAALLLVVAALGEFRRGAGVDVGEEIRTVVDQGPQVEVETLDQPLIHLLLKGSHVLGGDLVHMVPEVLRGEPGRVGGEQAGERRLAIPVGEVQLAGGGDDAVDGRQEHVLAAREALMALGGERGIEQGEHLQAPGDMPEGSHIAEGGHHGLLGLWGLVAGLGGGDQVLDTAEIDGTDDFGFAVDALTVAGVVIGVAVDFLGGEAWHVLGHTTR